jgi:arabinofuranosyltransferase
VTTEGAPIAGAAAEGVPRDPAPRAAPKWHPGALGGVALGLAALGAQVSSYWPYVADDALITLRYSVRFAEGLGLTWTAGEPVEGYSNLLWTLLLAVPALLGFDPVAGLRVLGVLTAASVVVAVAWPWRDRPVAATVAALAVGADGTLGLWALGGLEQPLLAALVAVAAGSLGSAVARQDRSVRAVLPAAAALALACWTRPDAPLLVAMLTLGWWLAQGQGLRALRSAAVLAAIPAAATLAQVAGRLLYYNDWVPNTAHIKLQSGDSHVDMGALYVVDGLGAHVSLLLLAGLALVFTPKGEIPRARLRLLLPVLLAWPAYIIRIGGDIFPAQRHLVVWVALLAGLAGAGAAGLTHRWRRVGPLLVGLAVVVLGQQWKEQQTRRAWVQATTEGWVLEGLDVGELLRDRFGDTNTTLAISPAGAVPYAWRGNALDMLGLNDAHIAHQQPEDADRAWIGHAHGDGAYVLSQRPGLVLFRGPRGGEEPTFRSERELLELPEFREDYRIFAYETESGVPIRIWVDTKNPTVFAAAQ